MKTSWAIVGFLLVGLLLGLSYYGAFKTISPSIISCGGETLIYEKVNGDYSQSGIVSDRVYSKLLNDFQIETTKGFGIYYDSPKAVDIDKLYSEIGCILETKDMDKLDSLKSTFQITTYPVDQYLVVEFPYRGQLSVLLGLIKVYPALAAYSRKNGYDLVSPVMEIWDVPNGTTTYRKKLIKSELTRK